MKFTNITPLPAHYQLLEKSPTNRMCAITVKATFNYTNKGRAELELSEPYPIFYTDTQTELGILPRDDLPRTDNFLEVILLGAAYASNQKKTRHMQVTLSVGDTSNTLLVFGDRYWETKTPKPHISTTQEFSRMPLTPNNAFGGEYYIEIDKNSPVYISDPRNPSGKGLDYIPFVVEMEKLLNPPRGYPKPPTCRPLPNIEHPDRQISKWEDAPDPACWAPFPLSSLRQAYRMMGSDHPPSEEEMKRNTADPVIPSNYSFLRASPEWIIPRPTQNYVISLSGLSPDDESISFPAPHIDIIADILVGENVRRLPLTPKSLVILSDKQQLYYRYSTTFEYTFNPGDERSIRIQFSQ